MPDESSRKDLQIMCWSLLCQISSSWCNFRHKVSTSVKLFLLTFFILLLLSPGHFWANCAQVFQRNCRWDLYETSHVCSWVVCGLQCKILLTSQMTLTFQGHNYVKSYFGPYLGSCWTNRHKILTLGSLGWGLSINKKYLKRFERVTYANVLRLPPLSKKTSLTITFQLRRLGWQFWHLDICFQGQGIWPCRLFWPMTLTFQGHDLCKITFWAISQLLMGKMLLNFNTR